MGGKTNKAAKTLTPVVLMVLAFAGIFMLEPAVDKTVNDGRLLSDTVLSYEISGRVFYKESTQPVQSGHVKAVRFDCVRDLLLTIDSTTIEPDGIYALPYCTGDSLFIMAYSDDELWDFVPGYHDTTIYWQSSIQLTPSANIRNANVHVNRIVEQHNGTHRVKGRILKDPGKPEDAVKDAIIYAKMGAKFKGFAISNRFGFYQIDSLPPGDFEIIAERIGYYKDYRYVQIGQFNTDTVNFYLSRVASVNPPGKQIPKEFALHNNYPNPFNPATRIKFSIPILNGVRSVLVKLLIYNTLGKEIDILVNDQLSPGNYEIEWDGTDYPSGVYFYRMIVSDPSASSGLDFTETRRMVLIK